MSSSNASPHSETTMEDFIAKARSSFPSLSDGYIFADNAGGSQASIQAIQRITDYLTNTNVQLGATYSISVQSTRRVLVDGPREAAKLFSLPDDTPSLNGGESDSEIVFGSSSTQNLENLARALEGDVLEDEEIIITLEHEANAGCWKKLSTRRGATIKYWLPRALNPSPEPDSDNNPYSLTYSISDLIPLISSKTRIVAFTACSNILGSILPVKSIVSAIRKAATDHGARKVEVSVDCVAYAPHRLIDVRDWDVDYAVFSFYKVYGPHISTMYTRLSCLNSSISSLVHDFLPVHHTSTNSHYKLQPGGPGYELVHGSTGALEYLHSLSSSGNLKDTFDLIAAHEQNLLKPLLGFLTAPEQRKRGVRVVGSEQVDMDRVPTVSFLVVGPRGMKSKDVVDAFDKKGGIGIRHGHFYAYSLVDSLQGKTGDVEDGVVRISLVHYNTVKEVSTIIDILKEVLGS